MNHTNSILAPEGKIKIYYLKEIWLQHNELRSTGQNKNKVEWKYINALFNALGIGLEPTIKYLMSSSPSFDEFESWIEKNGVISSEMINYFNSIILNKSDEIIQPNEEILSKSDLEKWNTDGYLIVKQVISKEDCEEAVNFICEKIGADLSNPESWYKDHPLKQGIMIQLFRSSILDKIRLSKKIRSIYKQLWKRNDLMVSMDRVSFNPPETKSYQFQGPNLHWDVSLKSPIPFGIQGLLYLVDTNEDQGAFTLIPGFHNQIESWLKGLDKTINPRNVDLLKEFKTKPLAANAGDFILWNHCLPHGSRPNTFTKPRIVQYINYQPLELDYHDEWI